MVSARGFFSWNFPIINNISIIKTLGQLYRKCVCVCVCVCVFTEREGERELLIDLLLGTYVIMEAEKFRPKRIDNIVPFQGRRLMF